MPRTSQAPPEPSHTSDEPDCSMELFLSCDQTIHFAPHMESLTLLQSGLTQLQQRIDDLKKSRGRPSLPPSPHSTSGTAVALTAKLACLQVRLSALDVGAPPPTAEVLVRVPHLRCCLAQEGSSSRLFCSSLQAPSVALGGVETLRSWCRTTEAPAAPVLLVKSCQQQDGERESFDISVELSHFAITMNPAVLELGRWLQPLVQGPARPSKMSSVVKFQVAVSECLVELQGAPETWRAVAQLGALQLTGNSDPVSPKLRASAVDVNLFLVDSLKHLTGPELVFTGAPAAGLAAMGFAHILGVSSGTVASHSRTSSAATGTQCIDVSLERIMGYCCGDTVRCLLCTATEILEVWLPKFRSQEPGGSHSNRLSGNAPLHISG